MQQRRYPPAEYQTYEGQQEFFAVASRIAREGRLSRFLYIAEKAG